MSDGCYDCGRPYGDEHGFPDLIVPDDVWLAISPTGDFGGLLCPSCICKRVADAGLRRVEARFMSGPFAVVYSHEWTPRPTDTLAPRRTREEATSAITGELARRMRVASQAAPPA